MDWLGEAWRRLMFLFRRGQFQRDLREEMADHVRMKERELADEGVPPNEARNTARREFGNALLLRERSRDAWGLAWLETLLQDLRYGLRQLRRNPGFTAVAVLTLALGIGASTAIFSVVDAVLIRSLPYRHPSRLVALWETMPRSPQVPVSGPDFLDWKQQNGVFSRIAVGTFAPANLIGTSQPEHVEGVLISPGFFRLLGTAPALGRTFLPDESQEGRTRVVILSYGLWKGAFGGASGIVGRDIELNGHKFTTIGVMPETFRFPQLLGVTSPDFYVPFPIKYLQTNRGDHSMWVVGRLKASISIARAQAEMTSLAHRLAQQYSDTNAHVGVRIVPLHEQLVGKTRPVLVMLLCAVGVLLLIACANAANLLLAQAGRRKREIAVRLAVGASPGRVIRQLVTESLLLGLIGGTAGILVAVWAKKSMVALSPAGLLPMVNPVSLNLFVLAFAIGLSLVTGLLFGLIPALQASKMELQEALKEGSSRFRGRLVGLRYRNSLAIGEVALALLLLIGCGLFIRTLTNLLKVHAGFNPRNVLTMWIQPGAKYAKNQDRVDFFQSVVHHVRELPGIKAAAFTSELPLEGGYAGNVTPEGQPIHPGLQGPMVEFSYITPGYFRVMSVALLGGRVLTWADDANAPRVAVINEAMTRRFWPNENPIGRRFTRGDPHKFYEVVGVVDDVLQHGLVSPAWPQAYFPYAQEPTHTTLLNLAVRTGLSPSSVSAEIPSEIRTVDRDVPVYEVETMIQIRDHISGKPRFETILMSFLASVALILAAVGIYGLMAYVVTQRTHEIGIRMALGAQKRDVLRLVLAGGMSLIVIGVGIGIAASLALTRFLSSLLYGVKPTDPLTFAAVSLLLTVVALFACWIPARRAAKVDPMVALRHE